MILDKSPEIRFNPVLLNNTQRTSFFYFNVAISSFVSTFHNFIVLSKEPLAKIDPFGLKATV